MKVLPVIYPKKILVVFLLLIIAFSISASPSSASSSTKISSNKTELSKISIHAPNDTRVISLDEVGVVGETTVSRLIAMNATTNPVLIDDVGMGIAANNDANIIVSPTSGLITTEAAATDTFTVVLTSQPAAVVTINLSSSNTGEGTVSTTKLVFNKGNWETEQTVTVTGVDDFVDDGDIDYFIQITASSSDPVYDAIDPDDVAVTNLDNDEAGIRISPINLTTSEVGTTDIFTVVLTSQPTATVSISLLDWDKTEGLVSPTSLEFTNANWGTPQTVTVTGKDDFVDDGDQSYKIITGVVISDDPIFNGKKPADVNVINIDNDTAGVTVKPTAGLITTESGITDTFEMVLTSQPTATVKINLSSSDETEGTVSPNSLTFSTANWNNAQTVTVTGVDDIEDDGEIKYTIVTGLAISTDPKYAGYNPEDVLVTNFDNETAGIIINPITGLVTTEAGGKDYFSVVLTSSPANSAKVTINLSSSDISEGLVSPVSLIFTSSNWDIDQVVTVTGVDDFLDDDDKPYQVFTTVTSDDKDFDEMEIPDVSVNNLDDDHSPVAVPDTYYTNGNTLTVNTPGVLGNDTDADVQDTLIATLQTGVSYGQLTFNTNGSFEYTPNANFFGEDTFRYRASDGINNSALVDVTLIVDRKDPTVEWVSPVGNDGRYDVSEGSVQLVANAYDDIKIERVRFVRWDRVVEEHVLIGNDYNAPYSIELDTSTLNIGFNELFVRAYDVAGNYSQAAVSILIYRDSIKVYLPLVDG